MVNKHDDVANVFAFVTYVVSILGIAVKESLTFLDEHSAGIFALSSVSTAIATIYFKKKSLKIQEIRYRVVEDIKPTICKKDEHRRP